MKTISIALMLLLAGASWSQIIDKGDNPGTLWVQGADNPLLDRTARKVGDLLTIIISETSAASFNATSTTSKKDSTTIGKSIFNDFIGRFFSPAATSGTSATNGSGTSIQNGTVTARLTAIVKQVLPNGSLVIEGTRTVMVNRDLQSFKLSGIVRRDDVRADNTILSENIAEADIRMEGKGAIYDRQRRGLLTRLLDWLF